LLIPPAAAEGSVSKPFSPGSLIGVPVAAFPRWMVCPRCNLLASVDDGYFQLKATLTSQSAPAMSMTPARKARAEQAPIVLPSRFMIACDGGHLDDISLAPFMCMALAPAKPRYA